MRVMTALAITLALGSLVLDQPAAAQDEEKKLGWTDAAELSFVSTSGNSNTTTLGAKNTTRRIWADAEYYLEVGALYSRSFSGDRFGIGTPGEGNFTLTDPPRKTDTNRLYGKTGYGKDITQRLFWNVAFDAERNPPAGIEQRYIAGAGLGNNWIDSNKVQFRTTYNVTYTYEDFTDEESRDYPGFQLGYGYENKLTGTTTYTSQLTFNDSFDEFKDHRTDWYNGVTVAMTEKVGLKAGFRILYRNIPPLEEIKIYDQDPFAGAATEVGTSTVEKEKLDTNLTTSLVINF